MALLYQSLQTGLDEDLYAADAYAAAAVAGLNSADDTLPYSTSELNAPEYSSDDFRMFQFKVARCSKRFVHDWRACPFAHPTENARRRDPRLVKYLPVPCPDYKRGICLRGDACTYSHGVYECWLHPAKYRTQLCKEGPNCRRPVCFFAHTVKDLRQPSHTFDAAAAAVAAADDGVHPSVASALAAPPVSAAIANGRPSTDASFARLSSDEVMNNIQGGDGGGLRGAAEAAAAANATVAAQLAASPSSRQSSGSLAPSSSSGGAPRSPSGERSGSPNSPGGAAPTDPAAAAAAASDAAAAMAVLTQQQQAQAQAAAAQGAAAIARLSMDGRASLDASSAAAAAATTQAMLGASGSAALPPRMSLDSLMASRQAGAGWAPAAPPMGTPTAAGMLAANVSTLPLNEQPFPPGNAPRMSNAVARKLGLAPQRTSLDARLGKLRGGATPPRSSLDGILHALQQSSARSSMDQQQAAQQVLHAMNPQLAAAQAMAQLNGGGGGMPPQLAGYGGAPAYGGAPHGYAGGHGVGTPGTEGMGLHPALLNLVAAQMAPQQVQGGMGGMAPPGVPNGMHSGLGSQHGGDPSMAALMDSLNGWQLGGGGMPPRAASMDGGMGMAGAQGMHGRPLSGAYYEAKGIWGSQEAINNQAGSES